MSKTRKSESNFLVQGSILAVASIISRIIGLLYRIPLKSIIGDIGNDYYGTAMEIYSILLLISSYSLPVAVSKLVSARVASGQRKNAYRIFKGAILFALVSGTAAGLIVYFGAGFITTYIVKTPLSIFALRVLAPTLLIVALLGVIRGFFQGMGTMMPSAFSQLLEQVINAVVSVWSAYMLYQYGTKIGAVLGNPATYAEAYGAAGGTFGTGTGALAALLFTLLVFLVYRPVYRKMVARDKDQKMESYRKIFGVLLLTILPVLLSTTIYNITSFLDTSVFKQIAHMQGYKAKDYSTMWGIYVGEYKVLTNVPIAIASSLATSTVPSLSTAFASRNIPDVKRKTAYSIRFIMVIAIPCAVGMGVLASPILQLLFQDSRKMPEHMMQIGAVSIIFYSLSTLSNGILQGINRMNVPVKNAAITLVLHMGVLAALMYGLDLNIYAVVWANTFFSFMMCILNALAIRKYLRYRQEIKRTFVVPAICAAVMGGVVYGLYQLLMMTVNINAIATSVSIIIGACVYFFLLLLLRGLREKELQNFPMGNLLIKIGRKLHLM
ncbi:MAG: polysaccharide biosynthesis protein [Lachnospiraceae bacterium]|nr:polysaccharide biosynthesis protein [Lachnospiraceae bacterium]